MNLTTRKYTKTIPISEGYKNSLAFQFGKEYWNHKVRYLPWRGRGRKPGRPKKSEYIMVKRKDVSTIIQNELVAKILSLGSKTTLHAMTLPYPLKTSL